MNGTPRLRSAYPLSPQKSPFRNDDLSGDRARSTLTTIQDTKPSADPNPPLIPFEIVDAPTQRLYVIAGYGFLGAWKLWDFYCLETDDLDSTWNFLKWAGIDLVVFFCLPSLKIPWLEWSMSTTLAAVLLHLILDALLMFQIPIPVLTWLAAFGRIFYDRELSISEGRVKPASILHNSSLILGKQIIEILPEGSAMINPDHEPFCLDHSRTSVEIPIRINQTKPILIELLRFDLDTNENETITIGAKEAKKLWKKADNMVPKNERSDSRHLDIHYPLKKTGSYHLIKVIDETKLEVRRRHSDAFVVDCPTAEVKTTQVHKCNGELSNLILDVRGTPPLKVNYIRTVDGKGLSSSSLQSIQPDDFVSPSVRQSESGPLTDPKHPDISWARLRSVPVPLNESLHESGLWAYTIQEVHDSVGNMVNYYMRYEVSENSQLPIGPQHRQFTVHDRPKVSFRGCNSQVALQVAKNNALEFPVKQDSTGKALEGDMPITISYAFSPTDSEESGSKSSEKTLEEVVVKQGGKHATIQRAGWYDLRSVSTKFCEGIVLEPASCLLQNPQEPDLSVEATNIFDQCAGNSVGLEASLSLVGTPPFTIHYNIRHNGQVQPSVKFAESLRDNMRLVPEEAGHYVYEFVDITDAYYQSVSLKSKGLRLEQDVKPVASARIVHKNVRRVACIEEPLSFDIDLSGEGPWKVQYEVVERGKRARHEVDVDSHRYTIVTDKLRNGGEYSLALTSIQDRSGCKRSLTEETKFQVRHDRPLASFGYIDGKRSVSALDHRRVQLPLRLKGQSPWRIRYRNGDGPAVETTVRDGNGNLEVDNDGNYVIEEVHDASCPGTVDASGRVFQVNWVPRPTISLAENAVEVDNKKLTKPAVCEGDDDTLGLVLSGTPPYRVKYEMHLNPRSGSPSVSNKEFTAAFGKTSIRMDTSKAGSYQYKIVELSDNFYEHDRRRFVPTVIHQTVHSRPSAVFAKPGTTYAYCKDDASEGDEVIPIKLEGQPPFSLEIGIKHHAQAKTEIINIPKVNTKTYDYRVPRQHLDFGAHVITIHKVQDARGCQRWYDGRQISSVRVQVSDVPAISPTEPRTDFCVGERISYLLSGLAPFEIFYTFDGRSRKATSSSTSFKRIAEKPGEFLITGISDGASGKCKATTTIKKVIHEMPSVRISKGQVSRIDIHEGDEADIQFDFWGTPPFQFTYTRSTNPKDGRKSKLLETKRDTSYEHRKIVKASEAGVYEVVSIQDKFCSFSIQKDQGNNSGQKLLQ